MPVVGLMMISCFPQYVRVLNFFDEYDGNGEVKDLICLTMLAEGVHLQKSQSQFFPFVAL